MSEVIRQLMESQGRRYSWLARKARISESQLWRMVHGERPWKPIYQKAVADALGVDEAILFVPEGGEPLSQNSNNGRRDVS